MEEGETERKQAYTRTGARRCTLTQRCIFHSRFVSTTSASASVFPITSTHTAICFVFAPCLRTVRPRGDNGQCWGALFAVITHRAGPAPETTTVTATAVASATAATPMTATMATTTATITMINTATKVPGARVSLARAHPVGSRPFPFPIRRQSEKVTRSRKRCAPTRTSTDGESSQRIARKPGSFGPAVFGAQGVFAIFDGGKHGRGRGWGGERNRLWICVGGVLMHEL